MNLFSEISEKTKNYNKETNQEIIAQINKILHIFKPLFSFKTNYKNQEIDVIYLILLALDRLISDTFYNGSTRDELINLIKNEIINIYQFNEVESLEIAEEILKNLNNSANKQASFKTNYYDPKEKIIKNLDFRYIEYGLYDNYYQITKSGFEFFKIELEKDLTLNLELKDYAILRLIDNENYSEANNEMQKSINYIQEYLNIIACESRAVDRDIYNYDPNKIFLQSIQEIKKCLENPNKNLNDLKEKIDNILLNESIDDENYKYLKSLKEKYEQYSGKRSLLSRKISEFFRLFQEKSQKINHKITLKKELKLCEFSSNLELFFKYFDKDERFVDEYCLAFSSLKNDQIFDPFEMNNQLYDSFENYSLKEKQKSELKIAKNIAFFSDKQVQMAKNYIENNIQSEQDIAGLISKAKSDGLEEKIIKLIYLLAQDLFIENDEFLGVKKLDSRFCDDLFCGDNFKIWRKK